MRYLFCVMSFTLMSYSITQTPFNFTLKQSSDIDSILKITINNTNNNDYFELKNKDGNFYEFDGKSWVLADTLMIQLISKKYIYKSKICISNMYLSNEYPIDIKLMSYKRFLLPKFYNIHIQYDEVSQPFFAKRYKKDKYNSRSTSK